MAHPSEAAFASVAAASISIERTSIKGKSSASVVSTR